MKIPTDDLLLFGTLALGALGVGLVAGAVTHDPLLAVGALLMVFGIPSALIAFMAAGEPE